MQEGRLVPNVLHKAFVLNDDLSKGEQVGGGPDATSAVAIACSIYQQGQQGGASWSDRMIGVFDATDVLVAYIGTGASPL